MARGRAIDQGIKQKAATKHKAASPPMPEQQHEPEATAQKPAKGIRKTTTSSPQMPSLSPNLNSPTHYELNTCSVLTPVSAAPDEAVSGDPGQPQQQPPHALSLRSDRGLLGRPAADFGTASPCERPPVRPPEGADLRSPVAYPDLGLSARSAGQFGGFVDIGGMERKASIAFFTERSLAAYLAVSDRTIRNWIRRGELPSYKLGAARRIDPSDVKDFLACRREEAA
jgi:excisionase family DNA binding protein